jgi:hypothetical protein
MMLKNPESLACMDYKRSADSIYKLYNKKHQVRNVAFGETSDYELPYFSYRE